MGDDMRSAVILVLTLVLFGCGVDATEKPSVAKAPEGNQIGGTVLETFDAASYTYLRFDGAKGEMWAAIPQTSLEVGSQVVIANPQMMSNFESKTLGRTFETIYFGSLENQPGASSMPAGLMGKPATVTDPNAEPIKVARAEGEAGRTVAELFMEKGELAGKTVAIRGKVVKYNGGILGKNWIHLQDGTGDMAAGTNDITVTSSDLAAVGDVILVQGTLALDKDFGAGYLYPVLVEDATVK
jgi:hypothetical protein